MVNLPAKDEREGSLWSPVLANTPETDYEGSQSVAA